MIWALALFLLFATGVIGVWFLQRYFAKATLESAFVRTGMGGRSIAIDGGCLALPIVHKLQRIAMAAMPIAIDRSGRDAVMCRDHLRADMRMEFDFRVEPTSEGVATAAQALGSRISRDDDAVRELLGGFLIDAIQNAAANRELDAIHLDRSGFAEEVAEAVKLRAGRLGLQLISAALVSVDQSSHAQFDENNAFHAHAMRRLAEKVSEDRKARSVVEAATAIAIRESKLAQHERQLAIERAERELEIAQREHLDKLDAEAESRASQVRAEAGRAADTARIEKESAGKQAQVAGDEALRQAEMQAMLSLEEAKIASSIQLARRRVEEAVAKAAEEEARAQIVLAAEHVQSQKERAVAEREREVARLRQQKDAETEDARVKSEVDALLARAKAKATAAASTASAEKARMEAEAAGRLALYSAENTLSDAVIRMRLEKRRLDRMPEIMTQMMKPVEKIESIRINQISGLGGVAGGGERPGGADGAFGAAMEQILGMAVRLPAMKQMGEEIGLDFDANLAGRTADYANRLKVKKDERTQDDKA